MKQCRGIARDRVQNRYPATIGCHPEQPCPSLDNIKGAEIAKLPFRIRQTWKALKATPRFKQIDTATVGCNPLSALRIQINPTDGTG